MTILRKPLTLFVLSMLITFSVRASATTLRWVRYAYGVAAGGSLGHNGGGPFYAFNYIGMNCTGGPAQDDNAYCPAIDNDTVASYDHAAVAFQNSNPTQPVETCISYWNSAGGQCSTTTTTGNCGAGGVCSFPIGLGLWNSNMAQAKYLVFQNLTLGVFLADWVIYYNSTI